MKSKLRKITIDKNIYLWRKSYYKKNHEKLMIFLEGSKKSALRIAFNGESQWNWGLESGVIFKNKIKGLTEDGREVIAIKSINLHKPSIVKEFILYFKKNGWQPQLNQKELIIENGFFYLDKIKFPFDYAERIREKAL